MTMSDNLVPLKDAEVQEAFLQATQGSLKDYFQVVQALVDFMIISAPDYDHRRDVETILQAGAKAALSGGSVFVTEDGWGSYYFVGQKAEVIKKLTSFKSEEHHG